ncbi:Hypothetical protein AJF4211_002590 [Avibacterium paragallinarum JF4211]|nr:Hypothetical protein AJF4211_002590 [Avibacterium paragallinarum JF4211]
MALAGLIVQGMLRKKTLIKEIQREQQRVKYQSSQGESL